MIARLVPLRQTEDKLLPGGRLRGPTPYCDRDHDFRHDDRRRGRLALSTTAGLIAMPPPTAISSSFPTPTRRGCGRGVAARASRGVTAVRPVPAAEMRRTLERWLGPLGAATIFGAGIDQPSISLPVPIRPRWPAGNRRRPGARLVADRPRWGHCSARCAAAMAGAVAGPADGRSDLGGRGARRARRARHASRRRSR